MKNNITLIGVNYYPEESSTGLYTTQMAAYLAKYHHVSVITGFPYYPEWEIAKEYRDKKVFLEEKLGEIMVYRYKQYVPKNPSFKKRIIHLLDFTFGSVRNVFKIKKADVVICVVPFTSSIALGLLLAKLRGAKVWVHIQDFEFDAAVESGLAGGQKGLRAILFKVLFGLERWLLNRADRVSTISSGMIRKLENKTVTPTYFFPNWVDENHIDPKKAKPHELMLSEKFKILYSGNIGAKQDWDFFISVVKYFKNSSNIEFIVVGAGAKKEWLVEATKQFGYVKHYMPVEYATLPDLLCSADLHILFQKNEVVDTVMPSKLLGMMASAVPSVVTGNPESEVAGVFAESQGGYFFDSSDFGNVVRCIRALNMNEDLRNTVGGKAREYVIRYFSDSRVLPKFIKELEVVIHS